MPPTSTTAPLLSFFSANTVQPKTVDQLAASIMGQSVKVVQDDHGDRSAVSADNVVLTSSKPLPCDGGLAGSAGQKTLCLQLQGLLITSG
ncbi:unnamed protein product [Amoebophrya sp. A25]|nr:unnamed protein product [Amoebophrya sp. A25]|eukprot:GSA25T00011787001.1